MESENRKSEFNKGKIGKPIKTFLVRLKKSILEEFGKEVARRIWRNQKWKITVETLKIGDIGSFNFKFVTLDRSYAAKVTMNREELNIS